MARRGVSGERGGGSGDGWEGFGCGRRWRGGGGLAELRGYDWCTDSLGRHEVSSVGAVVARRQGEDQMAGPNAHGAPLTRVELREELDRFREELDRFRDEMHRELRHYATKADVANLKSWMVGLLLVVMLNVLGTVGAIVAAVLTA